MHEESQIKITISRLKALKIRAKEDPKLILTGICHSISGKGRIEEHFKTWEHYSGNFEYPVPATSKVIIEELEDRKYSPEVCSLHQYLSKAHKWTGRQGELRRHLIDHLLRCLKEELKQCELGK